MSMMVALSLDIYWIIIKSLKLLSKLTNATSTARMFDLLSVVTGKEGYFISEARVKETSNRVISEHFDVPTT